MRDRAVRSLPKHSTRGGTTMIRLWAPLGSGGSGFRRDAKSQRFAGALRGNARMADGIRADACSTNCHSERTRLNSRSIEASSGDTYRPHIAGIIRPSPHMRGRPGALDPNCWDDIFCTRGVDRTDRLAESLIGPDNKSANPCHSQGHRVMLRMGWRFDSKNH
jgi:hypothetical protein